MPFYCIFITVSLDSLKGYVGTGQQVGKTEIGLPGSKERVNFNKNIVSILLQEIKPQQLWGLFIIVKMDIM